MLQGKEGQMENKYNVKYGEFTRKMLWSLRNSKDNIVFSPVSLLILLGMLADATGSDTRNEIINVIGGNCYEDAMKWIKELEMELSMSEKIMLANAVFIRPDLKGKIANGYEDRLKNIYNGRLFATEDIAAEVNTWIKNQTGGMIPEIDENSFRDKLACLMNAVAFNARWEEKYEYDDIVMDDFHNADGTINNISMLRSHEDYYIENDYFTGFTKFYEGRGYSYMALLPKQEDYDSLERAIEEIDFSRIFSEREQADVMVQIPEYKNEFDSCLNDFFIQMGIRLAFSSAADFMPMIDEWVKVDEISHKAFLQLDRNGTKAIALSYACLGAGGCSGLSQRCVMLDRPFIYAVIHNATGLPVFVGRVNHLEKGDFEFTKEEYEISTDRLDEYEPEPHEFSSEEEKKAYAKKMFRKIAKNIHPGVNPLYETTKKIQDLYEELQNSYKECDVRMLDIIEHEVELILKE